MTWFRCGGGSGMPADLKNRMNAVFNKKFGTSIDYPAEDWPDDVNLMGPLPEKTIVSSPIADFSDGADDVPTKSLVVTIPPTLTGVSVLTEKQTGENLFDKATVIDNTWIVVNDTTTESAVGFRTSDYIPVKASTRYYVSTKGSNRTAYYDKNKNGIAYFSFSGGQSFNCLYDGYIRITIKNDIDLDTFIVNEGNTAITYEPYNGTTYTASLGRTIYGGQVDIVKGTGTDENGNDFTFTGQEIPTRLGYNAFWSEQGNTEVTYRADISLALQAVSGSRSLMMASRPAIEPANGDQGSEESTENNIETEGEEDAR